jgi:hypothetical protein
LALICATAIFNDKAANLTQKHENHKRVVLSFLEKWINKWVSVNYLVILYKNEVYNKKKIVERGSLESAITEEELEFHHFISWFWFS